MARAVANGSPSGEYTVELVKALRPSTVSARPTTTQSDPGSGSALTWAAIRPSTNVRPVCSADQPPGQSSAAHIVSAQTSSGTVHGAAFRRSASRPGNSRNPSARCGPQT